MLIMQVIFGVVLGLASLGPIAFILMRMQPQKKQARFRHHVRY